MPAIPAGVSLTKVQVVVAPFSIVAGLGSHVPFNVPSSTIAEELTPTVAELDGTLALEKLISVELLPGNGAAEDELAVAGEDPGSTIPVELEETSATDDLPFNLAEQTGSSLQSESATFILPA